MARSGIRRLRPARAAQENPAPVEREQSQKDASHLRGLRIRESWSFGCACASAIGIGLLKDTYNLGFQFRKFHGEHDPLGVEDQVASLRQQVNVLAARPRASSA